MFKQYILEPFFESAKKHSKRSAFCINEQHYTYEIFAQRVAAIAESLVQIKSDKIGLISNDDLDTYASIFAIWLTGKSYIPLNPDTPKERNQNVIDQVGIEVILDSNESSKIPASNYNFSLNFIASCLKDSDYSDQLAYIFFTSGSTGVPKGVVITKENVASFVNSFWALNYEIDETDRVLQMFELTFDLSVMSYLIPLIRGACVYTIPKDQIKYGYIYELMEEQELTVALMVPSMLNYLRPYFDEIDCPKMRYSLFCGEALNEEIANEWSNCVPNARIDNVYGPTENTIFCTSYTYKRQGKNDSINGILSIGQAMLDNLTIVFNENDEPASINQTGELCLAGPQLTTGYFNNPSLNQAAFFVKKHKGSEQTFYRTGDLCCLRENGNIDYIGRKDFQVKIQGYRIELSEVEYHASKAIAEKIALVAIATESASGNFEISLVFESAEFDITKAKEYMMSKMPSYMVPAKYFFIPQFPLNTNGKIDRKKLKEIIV